MVNLCFFRSSIVFTTFILAVFQTELASVAEHSSNVWLTGEIFRQELDRPFAASWTKTELRPMLNQVSQGRGISVVLDRRLDPTAECTASVTNCTLREGLQQFAHLAGGEASVPDNFVYLGPKPSAKLLRTLIQLRTKELQSQVPAPRRSELSRRSTVVWRDLETPREILDAITTQLRLKVTNADIIPHDLWAATELPEVTVAEALSVILIQFDLTFGWTKPGTEIELIPIPQFVSLERKYRPKQKITDALKLIHERFPENEAEIGNSEIVVKGTVEDHEAIADLLQNKVTKKPPKKESPHDLRDQVLTLKMNAPLSAFLKTFEDSGIHFEYDSDALKAAGIDLEQTIQIDVKQVPAAQIFKTVFEPVGLDFQMHQMTVKLKPKQTKNTKGL